MAEPEIDPTVPPSGTGCVECVSHRRLVVPPAPLYAVWSHRLLRLVAGPARHAHVHDRPPVITSFEPGEDWFWDYSPRAGIKDRDAPPVESAGPDGARPRRPGAERLAATTSTDRATRGRDATPPVQVVRDAG